MLREVFMSEAKEKKFASDDLKQFDGLNGRPFYIFFKGKVYDLTNSQLWPQGKHMGMHDQRQDLTEAIKNAPLWRRQRLSIPASRRISRTYFKVCCFTSR